MPHKTMKKKEKLSHDSEQILNSTCWIRKALFLDGKDHYDKWFKKEQERKENTFVFTIKKEFDIATEYIATKDI